MHKITYPSEVWRFARDCRLTLNLLHALVACAAILFAAPVVAQESSPAESASSRKIKYYKSTMLAGEVRQSPGKDSMGMDMVPVYEDEDQAESSAIQVDPVTQQSMGIRTAMVTTGSLRRSVRAVGTVDYNETAVSDVTSRLPGWVENLYADATGKEVHAGEPLLDLFSPEFLEAQAEFISTPKTGTSATFGPEDAIRGARMRLSVLGVSEDQIARLEKERKVLRFLRVLAPRSGIVVEKSAVQGMRTEGTDRLFRIADLSTIWLMAQIYERDMPFVSLGQEAVAKLSYYPDRSFRGRITFISPSLDAKTRTAMVRIEFHNPGYFLKPQMFANVEIESMLKPSAVLVPDMAVLRSGEKTTVFVTAGEGRFEPRQVHLGLPDGDGMVEVLHGLESGEQVVTSAQFLLDSESRLREAIQKMLSPSVKVSSEHVGHEADSGSAAPAAQEHEAGHQHPQPAVDETTPAAYVCPMPEHASITYGAPGKCPICGMALVPVTNEELPKLQEFPPVLYYTCPMPEHSDVRSAQPGKCPRCAMTLIPVTRKVEEPLPSEQHQAGEAPPPAETPTTNTAHIHVEPSETSAAPATSPQEQGSSERTGSSPHAGHRQ